MQNVNPYERTVYSHAFIIDAKTGIQYTKDEYCKINPEYRKSLERSIKALDRAMRIIK